MKAVDRRRRLNRLATKRDWMIVETPAAGSHLQIRLNGKTTVIPMHRADLPTGTFRKILKDLDLTTADLEI